MQILLLNYLNVFVFFVSITCITNGPWPRARAMGLGRAQAPLGRARGQGPIFYAVYDLEEHLIQ